jgi:hypothetical protein
VSVVSGEAMCTKIVFLRLGRSMQVNFGGDSGAFCFSKYIGIVAEFEGYGSYRHNFTVPLPYCIGNTCAANLLPDQIGFLAPSISFH